jgi:peptide/nickel transport system substrate-binding protein
MFTKIKSAHILPLLIILSLILAACQSTATPETVVETLVVTQVVEATPVEVIQVVTPTPEPAGPRTLVICMGSEPNDLSAYGGSGTWVVNEAVFGGIWIGATDRNSFTHQPILQEKLPNLADGDATLVAVAVSEGETVVDAEGEVVILDANAEPPIKLVPAGGGDPVSYQGGEFEMDQLSATFTMLPDLLWSDGTPITSSDSVFAFKLISDPDNEILVSLGSTASYEAIDNLTTVWTGLPGFLDSGYKNNFFGPAPEHLWGEYSIKELYELEEYTRMPVGWGPYIIDEWVQGESIILHKNPNYFRAEEGLPKFDTLVYRFVGQNSNANVAALLAGECDILAQSTGLNDQAELLLDLQAADQIKATFTTGTIWEHVDFGIQHVEYDDGYQMGIDRPDFFSDKRMRQAFAMCMDRQALVDTIFFGQSIILDSYVPPQDPLYNPDVPRYEFDVQAGSALLGEVGWVDDDGDPNTPRIAQGILNVPDGTPLEVAYETTSSPVRQQATAIIKESLAQCGIKANIQLYPGGEWFADGPEGKLFGRHFDLGEFAWSFSWCGAYRSSVNFGPIGKTWTSIQDDQIRTFEADWDGWNVSGFANNEFDAACNTVIGSLPDQARYEAAHKEAQRIFAENLPLVPLYSRIKIAATRPDMCGFIVDPTADTEFWNLEEFDYGEGCEE